LIAVLLNSAMNTSNCTKRNFIYMLFDCSTCSNNFTQTLPVGIWNMWNKFLWFWPSKAPPR